MTGEHTAPMECRVAGSLLTGEAVRYGALNPRAAPGARAMSERFEPGSLVPVEPVVLNLQHDPERRIATTADGSLRLHDSPDALRIEADLREGSAELALVRRGALRGLSVEFFAIAERREADVRVLTRAGLPAIGLVDTGSHETTISLRHAAATLDLELRVSSGRSMSAPIPAGKRLRCECSGPSARWAEFVDKPLKEAFDRAFEDASRDVLATWANYSQPLASKSRGTLRRTGPAEVTIDMPDDAYGRAALAAHESAGVVIRPYLDPVDSVGELVDDVMHYSKVEIRAFVVSSTDAREGWPTPKIIATPNPNLEGRARRFAAWL